jgi:hypothetical protein
MGVFSLPGECHYHFHKQQWWAMAYKIERRKYGMVIRFSGVVTYEDVLRSEQEIHSDSNFTRLRYVLSDYTDAEYRGLTESQMRDINALRIGGHYSNPRIKYAFVSSNPTKRAQVARTVADGHMLHEAATFDTFEQASDWAGL